MIGIALLVVSSWAIALPSAAMEPGSWPQLGGDPRHLGIATGEAAIDPATAPDLRQAWSSTRGGWSPFASPVVADGLVYIVSAGDLTPSGRFMYLFAFHLDDGTEAWSALLGGPSVGATTTPAIDAGTVFVPTNEPTTDGYRGRITALDATTGAFRWSTRLGGDMNVAAPVAVDGSTVLQAANNGRLYALDATTGAHLWTRQLSEPDGCEVTPGQMGPCPLRSTPAVVGRRAYLVTGDGTLEARRIRNGSLVWSSSTGLNTTAAPSVREGRIYVTGTGVAGVRRQNRDASVAGADPGQPGLLRAGRDAHQHLHRHRSGGGRSRRGALAVRERRRGAMDNPVGSARLEFARGCQPRRVRPVGPGDLRPSANDGAILWHRALGTNNVSSPAVADGHVVAVTMNSSVPVHAYALPG